MGGQDSAFMTCDAKGSKYRRLPGQVASDPRQLLPYKLVSRQLKLLDAGA